jgi:glycosyltransferase involved in cell wall biosynthesis
VHDGAVTEPPPVAPLRVHVDVSDTAQAQWRAGIQRVVVQLVEHLERAEDPRVEVVPLVWFGAAGQHRRLTDDERAALSAESTAAAVPGAVATPPTWRRGLELGVRAMRRVLRPLRRGAVWVLGAIGVEPALRRLRRDIVLRRYRDDLVPLIEDLASGSVLLELDSIWNRTEVDRERLYTHLDDRGVHLAVLVYDLLPVEHPEWFEDSLVRVFTDTLRAEVRHADAVMAISAHTAEGVERWSASVGATPPAGVVVPLGADLAVPVTDETGSDGGDGAAPGAALPAELVGRRYVLVVGTVEPRKNHRVLLDAFEQVWELDPQVALVIVGRAGWNNDETIDRLRHHPRAGRGVHWYEGVGDQLLATLYRHADVVAVPSVTEGFGLPVIESLCAGVPVLSSTGGALPEAGGDLVDFADPSDPSAWAAALDRLLHDDEHRTARRAGAAAYRPPTWSDTATQVIDELVGRFATTNPAAASGSGDGRP